MKRRDFFGLIGAAIACIDVSAAQQPNRIWRIGILHGVPPEASLGFAAFRQNLIHIVRRFAPGFRRALAVLEEAANPGYQLPALVAWDCCIAMSSRVRGPQWVLAV